jgi:hypothetical protein|tara:strand:- start:1340 stop:1546 length:207 start_codon:yes stop_codon:yes gene_type:complete
MMYLNGNYDYESLARLALEAFLNGTYGDLVETNTLTGEHVAEASDYVIHAILHEARLLAWGPNQVTVA